MHGQTHQITSLATPTLIACNLPPNNFSFNTISVKNVKQETSPN